MNSIEAFPLAWPAGMPRAKNHVCSQFSQTLTSAQTNLTRELDMLGASQAVVTTNMGPRKNDGTLYANAKLQSGDPGVAVYFTRKKLRQCIACDKYVYVWENIQAISKTIEAMRGIERWGSSDMLDRAFQGFAALPAPTALENWWEVLRVRRDAPTETVEGSYRDLAKTAHPDAGGTHEAMSRLNQARDSFRAERYL